MFFNLIVLCTMFNLNVLFSQTFAGGSGTEGDPYLISSKANLDELADIVNNGEPYWSGQKYFRLINDITEPFQNIIGIVTYDTLVNGVISMKNTNTFCGSFDGGGYRIVLDINLPDESDVGLFGCIELVPTIIKNVILEGRVVGNSFVGGLIGSVGLLNDPSSMGPIIMCCYSHCDVTATEPPLGYTGYEYLTKCVGGLVGFGRPRLLNCYTTGNVSNLGTEGHIGGLVGHFFSYAYIINCYSTGNVISIDSNCCIGGLVGSAYAPNIFNSYFAGNITSDNGYAGGLIGCTPSAYTPYNCYYIDTWSSSGLPSNEFGTPLTANEMKSNGFVKILNQEHSIISDSIKQMLGIWKYDSNNVNNGFPVTTCGGGLNIADNYIQNIAIFPNPTNATSTLTLDLEKAGNLKITLEDLLGSELLELHNTFEDTGTFATTFSLETFPTGVYFLKINHNGNVKMEKVIRK